MTLALTVGMVLALTLDWGSQSGRCHADQLGRLFPTPSVWRQKVPLAFFLRLGCLETSPQCPGAGRSPLGIIPVLSFLQSSSASASLASSPPFLGRSLPGGSPPLAHLPLRPPVSPSWPLFGLPHLRSPSAPTHVAQQPALTLPTHICGTGLPLLPCKAFAHLTLAIFPLCSDRFSVHHTRPFPLLLLMLRMVPGPLTGQASTLPLSLPQSSGHSLRQPHFSMWSLLPVLLPESPIPSLLPPFESSPKCPLLSEPCFPECPRPALLPLSYISGGPGSCRHC